MDDEKHDKADSLKQEIIRTKRHILGASKLPDHMNFKFVSSNNSDFQVPVPEEQKLFILDLIKITHARNLVKLEKEYEAL